MIFEGINNTIMFSIISIVYMIFFGITFLTKKKIKTLELNIFKSLIIINIISLITECSLIYFIKADAFVLSIVLKTFNVCIFSYIFVMAIYTYFITHEKNEINTKSGKLLITILLYAICAIILFSLPVKFNDVEYLQYSYGPSVNFLFACIGLTVVAMLVEIFTHLENVKTKKSTPIIILILLLGFNVIIQYMYPNILLANSIISLVTFIMYFTIENPDLQMLREFHKAREREEESNTSKTNFIFTAQNKIKQPILEIKNISSDALNINDPEELKNEIRRIQASTNELSRIVNDVLDISEIENKVIDIKKNKYNLLNMFTVINKNFEKTLPERINYRFNFDSNVPEYLYGDSIRLKQVLNIVLENAREYTKEGFIEVNVHSIIKNDICRIIITIEDSGIGMTPEEQNHLFDKEKIYSDKNLKTVDDTKNNLSLAKSIITLMGGSIMTSSEIGNGSKFTIIVDQKIYEEKTKVIETVEKYEEMYEHNKKIMLVINSEDLSKKLNKILKKQNYDIIEVKGGQACLERLRDNQKFDLILMEEKLEKLSSEDTLIKKKDTPGYKIPVVLISDNKGFGAKEMYQEKGFNDVVFMPIKKEQVLETIKTNLKD